MKRMIVIREASMATTTVTTAIDHSVDVAKEEGIVHDRTAAMEDVEAVTAAMEVEREDTTLMGTTMVKGEGIAVIAVIAVIAAMEEEEGNTIPMVTTMEEEEEEGIAAIAAVEVKEAAIAAMEEEEGEEEESTMATIPMERAEVTEVTAVKRWRSQRITPD